MLKINVLVLRASMHVIIGAKKSIKVRSVPSE